MVDLKLNAIITAGSERAMEFLDRLGRRAKENLFSFDKMTELMNKALVTIRNVGLGAVAAFTGLALTSPTVQAALARMQPALFSISETIGKALKPGLDIIGGTLKKVSGWLKENTWFTDLLSDSFETLAGWADTLITKFGTLLENPVIKKTLEFIIDVAGNLGTWLIDNALFTIIGALLGFKVGGPVGALIGGGIGAAIDLGIWGTKQDVSQNIGMGGRDISTGALLNKTMQPIVINNFINGELIRSDDYNVNYG